MLSRHWIFNANKTCVEGKMAFLTIRQIVDIDQNRGKRTAERTILAWGLGYLTFFRTLKVKVTKTQNSSHSHKRFRSWDLVGHSPEVQWVKVQLKSPLLIDHQSLEETTSWKELKRSSKVLNFILKLQKLACVVSVTVYKGWIVFIFRGHSRTNTV